jgi:hypothetical protein
MDRSHDLFQLNDSQVIVTFGLDLVFELSIKNFIKSSQTILKLVKNSRKISNEPTFFLTSGIYFRAQKLILGPKFCLWALFAYLNLFLSQKYIFSSTLTSSRPMVLSHDHTQAPGLI